jgi:transcriptional regulator with XRE-family HTH domain
MARKQCFGKYLNELLQKYGIKGAELAEVLGVSRQYVSSIITDKKTPSRECFDAILTFLDKYLTPVEEQALANKLIYAKTGLSNPFMQKTGGKFTFPNLEEVDTGNITVDEQIVLNIYRALIPKARMEVINFLRQKEMEMIELQHELVKEAQKDQTSSKASDKANGMVPPGKKK